MNVQENEEFYRRLDLAIISGEGSGSIGKRFRVNPTTVRRRRSVLRKAGQTIEVRSTEARDVHAERS